MTDPKTKRPADAKADQADTAVDPRDLVRTGGLPANPQEAVQSPMVAPEMLNAPGDLRDDVTESDEDTAF